MIAMLGLENFYQFIILRCAIASRNLYRETSTSLDHKRNFMKKKRMAPAVTQEALNYGGT
jgi:hypothetical protein